MDLKTYCRRHNVVPYHDFIADLQSKSIIFIGEVNHFSPSQENNEKIILTALAGKESMGIATEDISDPVYRSKREMLSRFSSSDLHYLPSENRPMLAQLEPMLRGQQKLIVVVGAMHLNGPFSIDALVKRIHPEKSSVAVFLDDNITPQDIYKKNTLARKDYIVAGNILI
ncbi:MAG: hypothetical protein AABY40_00530 [Nanoarchaeota archaeon]